MVALLIKGMVTATAICAGTAQLYPVISYEAVTQKEGQRFAQARAQGKSSFSEKEIEDALSAERNMAQINRLAGLLTDLLREQKRVFFVNNGAANNVVATKAEELINEAGMSASQGLNNESFEILAEVYELILESLNEMQK